MCSELLVRHRSEIATFVLLDNPTVVRHQGLPADPTGNLVHVQPDREGGEDDYLLMIRDRGCEVESPSGSGQPSQEEER